MERSGGIGEWDARTTYSEKIKLSQKKKKKLLCGLARHPMLSAKQRYCRYNYMSISRPIEYFLVVLPHRRAGGSETLSTYGTIHIDIF